jgi:hypothetical protein
MNHRRILTELDALPAEADSLKRLQAETAAELVGLTVGFSPVEDDLKS